MYQKGNVPNVTRIYLIYEFDIPSLNMNSTTNSLLMVVLIFSFKNSTMNIIRMKPLTV